MKIEDVYLEWVPTYEGVLLYCPDDLKNDVPLRFWRVRYSKKLKRNVRYRIYPQYWPTDKSPCKQIARPYLCFSLKNKAVCIRCSKLTMLCVTGFAIADNQKYVVDHINNNTCDDRPSNLRIITREENTKRSGLRSVISRMTHKDRSEYSRQRKELCKKIREETYKARSTELANGLRDKHDIEYEIANKIMEETEKLLKLWQK